MSKRTVAFTLDPASIRAIDRIRRENFLDSASAAVRLALGREAARPELPMRAEAAEVSQGG